MLPVVKFVLQKKWHLPYGKPDPLEPRKFPKSQFDDPVK